MMMDEIKYIVGLDMGQTNEYTAMAILERTRTTERANPAIAFGNIRYWYGSNTVPLSNPPVKKKKTYAVRHLERFPLGTPYPETCDRLVDLFSQPPMSNGTLVVDQTSVGRAVVDLIRQARPQATIHPMTITAGYSITHEKGGWYVPKKELVGVMQILLQSRRLQVARQLPMAAVLVRELETFRVKVTASANENLESWRERDHDDLVLAVAMAAWVGERALGNFCIFV
jgi:hypothetical protein